MNHNAPTKGYHTRPQYDNLLNGHPMRPTPIARAADGHPSSIILTFTGARLDLRAPAVELITLRDIAHALSHIGRFCGAGDHIATVAQHCVHVSLLSPPAAARWALLHDASEAYLGDVSSPLKTLLPEYRHLEEIWQHAISTKFGVPRCDCKPWDVQSMLTERRDNGPYFMTDAEWIGLPPGSPTPEPDPMPWTAWGPARAEASYLARAEQLGIFDDADE
jgi:uncharacterized protein